MTKLASIQDVHERLRFNSINDIDLSIDSALEVATSTLESDLRNESFDRETRYDLFIVKHRQIVPNLYEYHWRLSRGFLDSVSTFTVKVADSISDFGTSNNKDITSEVVVDYTKGLVSLVAGELSNIQLSTNSSKLIGNFVRVDYTSGFNSNDNPGFFDTDEVPVWLKEAAVIKAINVLDAIDPKLRSPGEGEMSTESTSLLYNALIQKNIRYYPKYDIPALKS